MGNTEIIKLIWPVIVIQLAVQIYAIVDVIKRKRTKNLSQGVWILIIVFGEIIGSVLYLLLGRSEE